MCQSDGTGPKCRHIIVVHMTYVYIPPRYTTQGDKSITTDIATATCYIIRKFNKHCLK